MRAFRLRTEDVHARRLWPRIAAFLGSCLLVVFLAVYVTDGDLDLVPWFIVGVGVLWVAGWFALWRTAGRRRRERVRLERFAQRNSFTVEFDVTDDALEASRPELLFRTHPKAVTGIRMRGRCRDGADVEIGVRSGPEPSPAGDDKTVTVLYFVVQRPTLLRAAHPVVAVVDAIEALPEATAGTPPLVTTYRVQELGDHRVAYLTEVLDLTDPVSWKRLGAVGDRLASAAS
ncbi:hypothetical protein VD659_11295 [Herbiconiux sp. 11R-BC]|uniref:hypothetical protein n=1 Tax=Herbiconiux sp. 11R-BC TaxID=3111637 RepID=UPI003BFFB841